MEEEDALLTAPSPSTGHVAPRGSRVLSRGLQHGHESGHSTHHLPALPAGTVLCCSCGSSKD